MAKKPLKVIAGAPDKPLVIGSIEIPCYVLEGEQRVLSQRGLTAGIGLNPGAGFRMPQFLASKAIKPFVNKRLMPALDDPIVFQNPAGGGNAYGYPAEIIEHIIDAIIDAERVGSLPERYASIAERMHVLNRGLRRIGIIGLVDEATGYQEVRARKALATILENFISDEVQPWKKTFPYEFYKQIFKLKGWPGPDGVKRPSVIGHYTDDIVYKRVAPGVFDELKKLNPALSGGGRKWRNHQWFKPDPGYIKLNQHIAAVIALMKASANWDKFQSNIRRAFPKLRDQLDFDFDS